MTTTRVTQSMLSQRSVDNLQLGLGRLARLQEQFSTGRAINRPSDSPTGTSTAMRLRDSLSQTQQHQRAADDAAGWLSTADTALTTVSDRLNQARGVALQGANTGSMSQAARDALAASVDQIREGLLSVANTRYLDRPVFGGITVGDQAYDATGAYVGQDAEVRRTVGDAVKVRVDVPGAEVFGPEADSVFVHLADLASALRAGDQTAIGTGIDVLNADLAQLTQVRAQVGTRAARVEQAQQAAADAELRLRSSLSDVENIDLPATIVDLKLQETAYQAALAATARVLQPSLVDFLR